MGICYIFGALDVTEFRFKPSENDYIIAADGGLKNVQKFNLTPNCTVGDFDSLKYVPSGDNVIKHPVKKDDTDTILAVNTALEKGYKNFVILGCLGGRLDQTYASTQTASYIAEKGGNAVFCDGETYLTVIKNNKIRFSCENSGLISIFACSGVARKVSINNLLYELSDVDLTPDYPLGVSNEFTGKDATVTVGDGKLCIIWNGATLNYSIGG